MGHVREEVLPHGGHLLKRTMCAGSQSLYIEEDGYEAYEEEDRESEDAEADVPLRPLCL